MHVQGFSNGGQVRDIFLAYNAKAGSEVVDMSRNYNTGDKYSNRIGTGNQIDLALAEVSAHDGSISFRGKIPDYGNGKALKAAMAKLIILASVDNPPVWSDIDDHITITQTTGVWPMSDLNDYVSTTGVTTFTVTTGALPAGITLDGITGLITGNPSAIGSGTVAFTATDDNGATESAWIKWTIVP